MRRWGIVVIGLVGFLGLGSGTAVGQSPAPCVATPTTAQRSWQGQDQQSVLGPVTLSAGLWRVTVTTQHVKNPASASPPLWYLVLNWVPSDGGQRSTLLSVGPMEAAATNSALLTLPTGGRGYLQLDSPAPWTLTIQQAT